MVVSNYDVFQIGHTAVITGAGSGIGRAAAFECALKGMNVWMIDIDEDDLKKTKADIKDKVGTAYANQRIQAIVANVSDEKSMKFVAKTVFTDKSTKSVHFLMNNAAKSIGGNAIDTPMSEFITMMQTNLYGTIQTCQLFIPQMKELGEPGIIVNTGSKQGISMPPGNLTYNITKAALKTYTEGLEHELMMDRMNNCGTLKASLLIPGWVNTSIKVKEMRDRAALSKIRKFNYDRMKKIATCEENPADGAWMPKEVIDFMLQKLDDGSFYIICPDNEIDALADKARMTWAMQDIMEDRPPMSRWHPEWKGEFDKFLQTQKCFD